MSSFVLVPWPETAWSAEGRIASRTPLPLNESGRDQARAWAEEMAGERLTKVYSSRERASLETAQIIAEWSDIPHKTVPELAEVDAGLWDGLTTEELKRRYPKAFKRWCNDPSSVCPPEGEDLNSAFNRLREALDRVTRKHGDGSVAIVLGPLALGLMRCVIESAEPFKARSMMEVTPLRYPSIDGGPGSSRAASATPISNG